MDKEFQSLRVNSFVRGYHVYMEVWESLKREPKNKKDRNAVAVVRERSSIDNETERCPTEHLNDA